MNIPYELISAGMLIITLIFYTYKNWLDLRKNKIFRDILVVACFFLVLDTGLGFLKILYTAFGQELELVSGILTNIVGTIMFYLIFLYDLAVVKRMRMLYSLRVRVLKIIMIFSFCVMATLYVLQYLGYLSACIAKMIRVENLVQNITIMVCLVAGGYYFVRFKKYLSGMEYGVMLGSHVLLLVITIAETTHGLNYDSMAYGLAFIFIVYYMLLHNIDQYRYRSSGCFVREGFNVVIREKAHYRENFTCLGICISNTESITNYCTQDEIKEIHHILGRVLNKCCKRREVYHTHSFEYVIMTKNTATAETYYEELKNLIPGYVRIHNKNIALNCGFYTLEFADAAFGSRDFNRIQSSLRRLAAEQQDRQILIRYQGDRQQEIQNELEALYEINNSIANQQFALKILPIQAANAEGMVSYELIPDEHLPNGDEISQERIWEIVQEVGYNRDINYYIFEANCKYIKDNRLLEKDIEKIHMNIAPFQLVGVEAAKEFVAIIERYEIPFEKICLEITIDQTVRYDVLKDGMLYLKKFGITLLFDQFGVSVCNLKYAMNLPFDSVKINHHMVRTYCEGKSQQLSFMINMLIANGWKIYIDGVDSETQLAMLAKLDIAYIQGGLVSILLQNNRSGISFAQLGGNE